MRRLITVRADERIHEIARLTLPSILRYVDKVGADFLVLGDEPPVKSDDGAPYFRILKLGELLKDWDRILNLDADLLVSSDCPDLFDVVPEDCVGSTFEDVGSREMLRHHRMIAVQEQFGDVGWTNGYVNTGVFVVSKMHAPIFDPVAKYWTSHGADDVHLGWTIHACGFKVHELDRRFNTMTNFCESPLNLDRFKSWIVHYAGAGVFEDGIRNKVEQIKRDLARGIGL